ncbi:MAG: hypothetical protein GYA15_00700 [Leptolinea sp.]|jgi:hypothetical protein|nr:hypothetical protein [Leptolinea sp.]
MMNSDNPQPESQTDQGFDNLILVILLLLVFMMASRTPLDSDLWWHLRSGQVMAETGKPLLTDIFSYTRYGQPWVNHSWLGEVVIYGIYRLAGWTGISVWMGLMAGLIAGIFWVLLPGGKFTRAAFILLASVACGPLFTPRPQLFSLVLVVLLIWLVTGWMRESDRRLWLILPLFALWSNLHGGYMLGVLYLLGCAAGCAMDGVEQSGPERILNLRRSAWLLAASAGGYLSAVVNPNGVQMWLIPFQTVGVDILRQFIQEWASPDFHSIETWAYALYLLTLLFTLFRKTVKTAFSQSIPACLFILLSLYARRNIAVAVVVALPPLVGSFIQMDVSAFINRLIPASWHEFWRRYRSSPGKELSRSQRRIFNLLFAGLLSVFCFVKLAAVTHPVLMGSFESKGFPREAVDYLISHSASKDIRLFNTYNWGGYLIWKMPDTRIFIDGRTDLFGDEILSQWLTITQASDGWQTLVNKWKIDRVITEPDRPLVSRLLSSGWVEVYRDRQAVILDKSPGVED